jgi:DNA polymerase-3 subunit epsilon
VKNFDWILIDTQTSGSKRPIHVIELAAQKMQGWERNGDPFRRLMNHKLLIPVEESSMHGYTQSVLERDGDPPDEAYRDFEGYVEGKPIVAYDLAHQWGQVLVPEWERLGIPQIGVPGFCAYLLAQRLLDPVPAGSCKLQTLRDYYRLPGHGDCSAMGGVDTVIDLMQQVLRLIAEERSLDDGEALTNYTKSEWYPSRLPFGKYKGRPFLDADADAGVRSWLLWLAESSNPKSARMGRWYIEQLASGAVGNETLAGAVTSETPEKGVSGLVSFKHPGVDYYQRMVEQARIRLADLELEYSIDKAKVDSVRSRLFESLRSAYQERDRLWLLIQYRNAYIDALLDEGEGAAEETVCDYEQASAEQDKGYDSTASALEGKREINEEESVKLKKLWKELVRMYHPDQYEQDPVKKQTYELLTQAINGARDRGDIKLLELIAKDPQAFILSQGWAPISLEDSDVEGELRSLYEVLQIQILEAIELLEELRSSPDFRLFQLAEVDETAIDRAILSQKKELEKNQEELKAQAEKLAAEIEELTGKVPF